MKVNADLYGTELKERVVDDIIKMESEQKIHFKSHYKIKIGRGRERICAPTEDQKRNYLIQLIFDQFGDDVYNIYQKTLPNTSTTNVYATIN